MSRFPKPSEGSWTEHYSELGTARVSYEDCLSPEFYALERGSCIARMIDGSVDMRRNDVLTSTEIDDRWILTCQAVPTTLTVRVVYEL